jgi:cell wall-associated NlpC family hydrolase
MITRRTRKLLILSTLVLAFLSAPASMAGFPIKSSNTETAVLTSSSAHATVFLSPTDRVEKRKTARKVRAIAVLREYLPRYADILEAQMVRFEEVFFSGSSVLPVTQDFDPRSPFVNPVMRLQLMQSIDNWLGTRYHYGGRSKRGIDCSGFTSKVMTETLGREFRGSSRMQARQFTPIFALDSLQFGDIIFFTGTNRHSRRIGHVGIYLGGGVFAHASTSRGVTFNHITDGYYERRYRFGGRFVSEQAADAEKAGVFASP